MKNTIKTIIFIIILFLLFNYVFSILWGPIYPITLFYNESKNSLDIIYVGASNTFINYNTVLSYDIYGYTTGMMSSAAQPFPLIKYLIEETKKYQNSSLYIIDITRITDDFSNIKSEDIRKATDNMKFSKNRINAINKALSYENIDKKEYINYYFSFFIYHNKWKNINNVSFEGVEHSYKGHFFKKENTVIKPQKKSVWNEYIEQLPNENIDCLIDLINYIKINNLNVLFVTPIRCFEEEQIGKLNYAMKILEQNKCNYINFNEIEKLKCIDFKTDLYDNEHLNVYGTTKYTLYFAKYLKENYDLPDHRGDEKYISWEKEYKRFKKTYKEYTKKSFNKLLTEYSEKYDL